MSTHYVVVALGAGTSGTSPRRAAQLGKTTPLRSGFRAPASDPSTSPCVSDARISARQTSRISSASGEPSGHARDNMTAPTEWASMSITMVRVARWSAPPAYHSEPEGPSAGSRSRLRTLFDVHAAGVRRRR